MKRIDAHFTCSLVFCFCCMLLGGRAAFAQTDRPKDMTAESLRAYVDRELYPKAYSILSSERLMFPMGMKDWPLRIDSRRQLFVDDYLVASVENLEREWHEVTKHPGNPIMVGQTPWEKNEQCNSIIPLQVRSDAGTGKFRMWYTAQTRYEGPGGISMRFPTFYAESDDGLKWHRPNLGILEYKGSKENNFVIHGGTIRGLFENKNAVESDKRYTALVWHEPNYVEREGYYLYTSPDGIHWTGDRSRYIIPSLVGYTMPQPGIGDTSMFRYDPVLGLYVCDVKFVLPPRERKMRCRGQCESPDLIHWTRPRFTIYPDEYDGSDVQIYSNISFDYESMWLGLLRVMHTESVGWKQVNVELSMSRDGYHWVRPSKRLQFLPLGDPDSWEPDYTDLAHHGPILVDDELWFYYRGGRHRNRDNLKYERIKYVMKLGLAKLRRDGFASLNGGTMPGTVITRPLTFSGKELFVNAEVGKDGWVKVAVLDDQGNTVKQYSLDEVVPVREDATKSRVVWKDKKYIQVAQGEHVRLQFQLKRAKLYAFWIE